MNDFRSNDKQKKNHGMEKFTRRWMPSVAGSGLTQAWVQLWWVMNETIVKHLKTQFAGKNQASVCYRPKNVLFECFHMTSDNRRTFSFLSVEFPSSKFVTNMQNQTESNNDRRNYICRFFDVVKQTRPDLIFAKNWTVRVFRMGSTTTLSIVAK